MPKSKKKVPFRPAAAIVFVQWLDAFSEEEAPDPKDDTREGLLLEEIGYMVADTAKYLKLGMEWNVDGEHHARTRMTIPKRYIKRYFVINPEDVFVENNQPEG